MQPVLLLEFNEVNFDYIRAYVKHGELRTFRDVLAEFGCSETTSEQQYEHLEPWIQWVTAHTGKSFADHGVFRLGDVDRLRGIEQIWERLQREKAVRVGAISPMNAVNRITDGFFVPDPWTKTPPRGSHLLKRMSAAVSQAVNDNATQRVSASSVFWLIFGALANARVGNYGEYFRLASSFSRRPWMRALFLDLLLADTFISQVKRHQPRFASLFLNAAAHIQHHYMFSSRVYNGQSKNPEWYLPRGADPLLDVYRLYDRILESVRLAFPGSRVMIATGLHQDPHDRVTYYWRLRNHAEFLRTAGVSYAGVHPRMSRDFLVVCRDEVTALAAASRLAGFGDASSKPIFEVDNRGVDLFVTLTYDQDIGRGFRIDSEGVRVENFNQFVTFVALKNGVHNGIGYFVDTGVPMDTLPKVFPLSELPELVIKAV